MMTIERTVSIDTFTVHVYNENETDMISIARASLSGVKPLANFKKGDSAAVAGFLSALSELCGTGEITIKGKQ